MAVVNSRDRRRLRGCASDFELCSTSGFGHSPYIPSYRLFRCPATKCKTTLSPSTLLSHILTDHRELQLRQLSPGLKVTTDVTAELKYFKEMEPTAIRLIRIQGTKMNDVPMLVNVCCLADKCTGQCSTKRWKDTKIEQFAINQREPSKRGQWVCLWLSSACNFDNWFSLRLFNKEYPSTSMTKICKPVLVQHPMTTIEILEHFNVVIVDHNTIKAISSGDGRLKMEITMHET